MFFRRAGPDLVRPIQKQLLAPSLLARQAGVEYLANTRSRSAELRSLATALLRSHWFETRINTGNRN
jgi:hypothetical protein